MIKAVIFDVDGVLIDSFEANLKFYQNLMVYAGYPSPTREMIKSMFHMTMEDVVRKLIDNKSEDEVKRIWNMGKNREVPYPYDLIVSPKNYETVIEELNDKYTLAIVTSRIRGGVFSLQQLAKFQNLFKTIIYFEDTEKHKPDPDPLLLACEKLNIKPEEAVYIGDTNTDIKAAKSAGMKVIIYSSVKFHQADATTNDFDKITDLVKELANRDL